MNQHETSITRPGESAKVRYEATMQGKATAAAPEPVKPCCLVASVLLVVLVILRDRFVRAASWVQAVVASLLLVGSLCCLVAYATNAEGIVAEMTQKHTQQPGPR